MSDDLSNKTAKEAEAFALCHPIKGVMVDSVCKNADEVWGEIGVEWPSEIARWEAAGWNIRPVLVREECRT